MERSLVRRIAAGVLVACLIVAAASLGWARGASRRTQEVDLPARGGMLVREADQSVSAQALTARVAERAPQSAANRKDAVPVTPSRGGERTAPVHRVQQGERSTYIWPVLAPISSTYGPRWGRNHNGIDLAANHGDDIKASRDGEVLVAGTVPGYGETVILQHADGSRTLYAHCSKLLVKPGQAVKQGQLIALVGSTGQSTGPHLHFEIIQNDQPMDPLNYLPKR